MQFVDSDDYIEKDLLADATKIIKSENSDVVIFDFDYVDESGALLKQERAVPMGNAEFSVMPGVLTAWPCAWDKLYKKTLFTENGIFYPDRLWFEDLATTPRILSETLKISYLAKPYYNYVQRSDSIMADSKKNAARILRNKEILTAYELSENYFLQTGKHAQYYSELEYLAVYHILFTATMRVNKSDPGNMLQAQLVDYTLKKYPHFEKNKYYKCLLSQKDRISIWFLRHKLFRMLHLILDINRKLKDR